MPRNNTPAPASVNKALHASEIGDYLLTFHHFAKDPSETLFTFENGVYRPGGDKFVREMVKQYAIDGGQAREWSAHLADETIDYLLADAPQLWPLPPGDVINLLNGRLDLHTGELRPHDHKFLSCVQLPVNFDPKAKCPAWDYLIGTSFPEDADELSYEIVSWVMSPTDPTQTAILLLGEGANGKSVYLGGLVAFLGPANVAGISLQKLEKDRFAAARLLGKLANVCPDIPNSKLFSTSVFKALTGGDLIHAERKYKESFEFRSFAKLIFSANQPPQADDSTYGFLRRWLVVPFDRTFEAGSTEHIPRKDLDAMLSSPGELSGVLNRAVKVWPRVQSHGFSNPRSCQKALAEFCEVADPLRAWLDSEVVPDPEGYVAKRRLWELYSERCKAERRAVLSAKAFGQALKRALPSLREGQKAEGEKRVEVYMGIRRKPLSVLPE